MSNHFREKVSIRIQSMKIKTPFTWAIFNANFIAICTANFAASKTRLENSGDFSAVGILPWSGISRRFRTYQECTFQGNSCWTCRWLLRSQWKSRQKYFTPPRKNCQGPKSTDKIIHPSLAPVPYLTFTSPVAFQLIRVPVYVCVGDVFWRLAENIWLAKCSIKRTMIALYSNWINVFVGLS